MKHCISPIVPGIQIASKLKFSLREKWADELLFIQSP